MIDGKPTCDTYGCNEYDPDFANGWRNKPTDADVRVEWYTEDARHVNNYCWSCCAKKIRLSEHRYDEMDVVSIYRYEHASERGMLMDDVEDRIDEVLTEDYIVK